MSEHNRVRALLKDVRRSQLAPELSPVFEAYENEHKVRYKDCENALWKLRKRTQLKPNRANILGLAQTVIDCMKAASKQRWKRVVHLADKASAQMEEIKAQSA